MNRYIESSSKDYLMNNTTNKSGEDSRDLDFIYTPGIEPRSIKASSSRYSISPKPEYTLEPEEENMILSRQIIEDFILRHSSPTPSSGEQLNTDSGSTPTLYTSPCPSTSISPQTSRAQLTITERNHILVSDVRTKEVQLDEVKCGKCKEWIKVSLTSIRGWEVHVNTCFNVNHLTALQIARRIELARDIRVTSFGPRHVECAFCCSRVTLKGAEDYVLKSWKLHIAHCRGWDRGRDCIAPRIAGQSSHIQHATAHDERRKRTRIRGLSILTQGSTIRRSLSSRAGLRSSAIRHRLRNTTTNQRSTKPSRLHQRSTSKGSRKKSRATEGGIRRSGPQPEINQPELKFLRPIDTRPSANTRARAVVYTRPEYLKQKRHVIG